MRYLGGKFRIRSQVVNYLESVREGRPYIEPFMGACWIVSGINNSAPRIASDFSEDLVLLWRAIQEGWDPPKAVTEEEYNRLKISEPSALRGFAGYGLSFSGKWFGGYARNSHLRDYCANARNSLLKKRQSLVGVTFLHCSYDFYDESLEDYLIYCDPPYANTTKYRFDFDHCRFWDWVRRMSRRNTVVVSEYSAPSDIRCVLEIPTKTDMRGANQDRVERLFRV